MSVVLEKHPVPPLFASKPAKTAPVMFGHGTVRTSQAALTKTYSQRRWKMISVFKELLDKLKRQRALVATEITTPGRYQI